MRHLFFLALCFPFFSLGQADTLSIPQLVLKTNASTLISPFKPALTLGADIRLAPRWSGDVSLGYFLGSEAFAQYQDERYSGPRLRAGAKYHYRITRFAAFHVGFEGRYHSIRHWNFRNTLRQGGQYSELLRVLRRVESTGLALRTGAQFYGVKNKRLVLEPYVGLGSSWHWVSMNAPYADAQVLEENRFFSFEYPEGKSVTVDLLFGVHLGFAF